MWRPISFSRQSTYRWVPVNPNTSKYSWVPVNPNSYNQVKMFEFQGRILNLLAWKLTHERLECDFWTTLICPWWFIRINRDPPEMASYKVNFLRLASLFFSQKFATSSVEHVMFSTSWHETLDASRSLLKIITTKGRIPHGQTIFWKNTHVFNGFNIFCSWTCSLGSSFLQNKLVI